MVEGNGKSCEEKVIVRRGRECVRGEFQATTVDPGSDDTVGTSAFWGL